MVEGIEGDWKEGFGDLAKFSLERATYEVYWITPKGKFVYTNKKTSDRLGYSKKELSNMYIWDVDPVHSRQVREKRWQKLKEEGSMTFESKHKTKDGEVYPVEITSHYIDFEGNEFEFAFAEDVSERKLAEERYREIFDESPVGIWVEDFSKIKEKVDELEEKGVNDIAEYLDENPDFVKELMRDVDIISVNDAVLEIYKAESLKEFKGGLHQIFGEKSIPAFKNVVKKIAEGKTKYKTDKIDKTLNGEEIHIFLKWSVLPDYEDTYERVIVTTMDISDRKRAEEELRESKERLERIIEEAPFPIMLHNGGGEVIKINEVWTALTGYSQKEIPTISDWTEKAYGKGEEKTKAEEVIENLHKKEGRTSEGTFEIKTKEGDKRTWDFMSTNIGELPDGRSLVLSMAQDITERKESREREQFLHSLFTHDLRNQMQVTKGYLELINEEQSEKQNERIRKAIDAVEKTLEVSDKLRKTVSAEKAEIREVKEEEFKKYITKAIKNKKTLAKEKDIEINHDIQGIKVLGGSLIEDIVVNLLENAIEHSNCNEINVSTREEKKEAIITVEDDGKGITEKEKEKLFSRDYTEKPSSGGLGLPLIKKITEMYKGNIKVRDSELGGVRFDVHLKRT